MIVDGYILDNATGEPVPYASVSLFDLYNSYTGVGVSADSTGFFTVNSAYLDQPDNVNLYVTATGYAPYLVSPWVFILDSSYIELERKVATLPETVVQASGKKSNNGLLLGLGLFALLLLTVNDKKHDARRTA
jgi:hypothetical protein